MNKCPRCDSPKPHLHPAMQFEGEVQVCIDNFHLKETPENRQEYRDSVMQERQRQKEQSQ